MTSPRSPSMAGEVCVVAASAVSPIGVGLWPHVMLARAEVGPDTGGAFVDDEGETISCGYCQWLAPTLAAASVVAGTRAGHLALAALADAQLSLDHRTGAARAIAPQTIDLVLASPALGWSQADRAAVEMAVGDVAGRISVRDGSAGFYEAVASASAALSQGRAEAAFIVAADSWISPARLAAYRAEMFDPWGPSLPRPAEGAAAIVLMSPQAATARGLTPLCTIDFSACRAEASHDDNDEPLDGSALSALLHEATQSLGSRRIKASFGPFDVGSLRRDTWNLAAVRNAWCFDPDPEEVAIEALIGHVGAASAALGFAFGVGVCLHEALPDPERTIPPAATFSSWTLSRAGVRGLALAHSPRTKPRDLRMPSVGTMRRLPLRQPHEERDVPVIRGGDPVPDADGAALGVAMDVERLEPVSYATRMASVEGDLLDRIAALLRMRETDGRDELPRQEARLLAQLDALPAAGVLPASLVARGLAALDDGDAWTAAAAMFGLTALDTGPEALDELFTASSSDAEVTSAALAALSALAPDDALSIGRRALAQPGAAALGLELLSMHGAAPLPVLTDRLGHEDPGVVRSALRAWSRVPGAGAELAVEHAPAVTACLAHPNPSVRFEAGRTLLLWGVAEPLDRLRSVDPLIGSLGIECVELCILGGQLSDMPHVESAIAGVEAGAALLDAIARFGHPGSWKFLLHYLEDAELADDALAALQTLFGELVPEPRALRAGAWRDALGARSFDPAIRIRRGQPITREVLFEECRQPTASRRLVAHRCDELAASTCRGGEFASILHRWAYSVDEVLQASIAARSPSP